MKTIDSQCKLAFQQKMALSILSTEKKNAILTDMSQAIIDQSNTIISENQKDLELGKKNNLTKALLDRLSLDHQRLKDISDSILIIRDLPDPIGDTIDEWTRPNNLHISKVRVPLGVIGIIYEARPNVTVDGIALALKTGNCIVLRGSSSAYHSNKALSSTLQHILSSHDVSPESIQLLENTSREGVLDFVKQKDYLSLVIPRGGADLIQTVVQNATVPSIETGVGNCHVYVDQFADLEKALSICINSKTNRPSVCNSCEGMVIHEKIAETFLPRLISKLNSSNVEIRGCDITQLLDPSIKPATQEDWSTEFLDLILSIKVVPSIEDAIQHISHYGSLHTEAIVSEDQESISRFSTSVDAAAIIVNASTRFTDGGQFGFGAEMGISTQKLHARGPVALPELTTYKYVVTGTGQIRD